MKTIAPLCVALLILVPLSVVRADIVEVTYNGVTGTGLSLRTGTQTTGQTTNLYGTDYQQENRWSSAAWTSKSDADTAMINPFDVNWTNDNLVVHDKDGVLFGAGNEAKSRWAAANNGGDYVVAEFWGIPLATQKYEKHDYFAGTDAQAITNSSYATGTFNNYLVNQDEVYFGFNVSFAGSELANYINGNLLFDDVLTGVYLNGNLLDWSDIFYDYNETHSTGQITFESERFQLDLEQYADWLLDGDNYLTFMVKNDDGLNSTTPTFFLGDLVMTDLSLDGGGNTATPEPSTMLIFALGMTALPIARRFRKRKEV